MATDIRFGSGYSRDMTRKPTYPTPPASEMNQWVRDALEASDMSQQALADRMTGHPGVGSYQKSMVNKMTKKRRVTMDEARAISEITGYPLPTSKDSKSIISELDDLEPSDREAVITLIRNLSHRRPSSSRS